MANTSIYNAFERMWQHVLTAIGTKADAVHDHDNKYDSKGAANSALESAKAYANGIKTDLLNGAGDAYDTLKELGELIDDNKEAIDALREIATGGGTAVEYNATISTSWTSEGNLYKQTISIPGLLSTDDGVVGLILSENYETSQLEKAEWGKIHRIKTADGSITVYATAVTTMELNIQMIVTRDGVIETEVLDGTLLLNGSVTADKISSSAKTQYFNVSLAANSWAGSTAPYSQIVTLNGILASDRPKVYFEVPAAFADLESQQSAFAMLYDVETANGAVTFKAKELPEVAFNVTLEVSRL